MNDPLTSTGTIHIKMPSSITLPSATNCAAVSGSGISSQPTCTVDSSTNTLVLSALSNNGVSPQQLTVAIGGVRNPGVTNPAGSITIYTFYSSDSETLISTGNVLAPTLTPDTIDVTKVSIQADSYVVGQS